MIPFDLCNAPATFSRIMNTIVGDGLHGFVFLFLNDILSFSRSQGEHEQYIQSILELFRPEKFFDRINKCNFYWTEVECLGFDVDAYWGEALIVKGEGHS